MITIESGDLLSSGAHILVCPCNTVGAPGKGLAAAFASKFPRHMARYLVSCQTGKLQPGKVLFVAPSRPEKVTKEFPIAVQYPIVCFFPTKADWRDPSRLEYIKDGLTDMVMSLVQLHDKLRLTRHPPKMLNIAMPALGCGLGGLKWDDVFPLINDAFKNNPIVHIQQYLPR